MTNKANEEASLASLVLFMGIAGTIAVNRYHQSKEAEKEAKVKQLQRSAAEKHSRTRLASSMNSLASAEDAPLGTLIENLTIDEVYLWEIEHLSQKFASEAPEGFVNTMSKTGYNEIITNDDGNFFLKGFMGLNENEEEKTGTSYNKLIGTHECILTDIVKKPGSNKRSKAFVRAGPRKNLHFNPQNVNAAIVTCGGLCPGLNNVIREITNSLILTYGTKGKVWGIRGGYKGFYDPTCPPVRLTPEVVENIHHKGGTMLSSSRGGFDLEKILAFIKKMKIQQLYVIGGDGTHRGAFKIHEGCMEAVRAKTLVLLFVNN